MGYQLLMPKKLKKDEKYPLVLFLHGAGERGDDNRAQLVHGMNDFSSEEIMDRFPAFVVAPQCPQNDTWANYRERTPSGKINLSLRQGLQLVDSLVKSKPIDPKRIYITGLSMGGFGTWAAISERPRFFAAAVPICGGGDPSKSNIQTIKHLPIWVAHGEADSVVPAIRSTEMVDALKKAGADPVFDLQKGVGHNSWSATYRDLKLYQWMFKQRKK